MENNRIIVPDVYICGTAYRVQFADGPLESNDQVCVAHINHGGRLILIDPNVAPSALPALVAKAVARAFREMVESCMEKSAYSELCVEVAGWGMPECLPQDDCVRWAGDFAQAVEKITGKGKGGGRKKRTA